jgi:uncharacterized membrane protein
MKNNSRLLISSLIISLAFVGCTNTTYDDIESIGDPILDIVTYQEVKPIIDNNCLNCHSNPTQNGAPMQLASYDNVKEAMLNRDLLNKISLNDGADGLMPLGGPRMSQASIDLIAGWAEDGLLEN